MNWYKTSQTGKAPGSLYQQYLTNQENRKINSQRLKIEAMIISALERVATKGIKITPGTKNGKPLFDIEVTILIPLSYDKYGEDRKKEIVSYLQAAKSKIELYVQREMAGIAAIKMLGKKSPESTFGSIPSKIDRRKQRPSDVSLS